MGAKAIINIKAGVIDLEGPVDFVTYYLDRYQGTIGEKGLPHGKASLPKRARVSAKKEKEVKSPGRTRGKRGSCTKIIQGYLNGGFFDEPRSFKDIKQNISESGGVCTDSALRQTLKRLAQSNTLSTTGQRRSLRYQQPVRE